MNNKALFTELHKILDEFDRVREKHNLKYSLFAGSLLGAVRHDGFIPWEDDLDVVMVWEDYESILALPDSEFKALFFFRHRRPIRVTIRFSQS